VSKGVWKVVETGAGKIGIGKAERRGSKGRSRKEETEKGEDDGSKESGRRMEDMG